MQEDEDVYKCLAAKIRAARVLLGWTQSQLAVASCLPYGTITRIELADGRPRKRTLTAVRTALGTAGVVMLHGRGARPPKTVAGEQAWTAPGSLEAPPLARMER